MLLQREAPSGRGKRNPKRGLRAVAYTRVSLAKQFERGVSVQAQEERIRARALSDGRTLAEVVCDGGESAASLSRPGLQRILADVQAGRVGAIYVYKLDRLTRSVRDLWELLDVFTVAGVALVSISESLDTSTANGRFFVTMLGGVAQWEREAIGERTATVLHHLRSQGRVYARLAPFGWRKQGDRLVPEARERSALAEAKRMREEGHSYRQIGDALAKADIKPRGRCWYPASVRAILRSRMATCEREL